MNQVKISINQNRTEKATKILEDTMSKMGFIPNMYIGMSGNDSLIESYTHAYASFREHSGFSAIEQEVIMLSVSFSNCCEYCMAAHSFIAEHLSKVPSEVSEAIRAGERLPDAKLDALSEFTKTMTANRGRISRKHIDDFIEAGYDESSILGVITGIAVKTMSNYSNHLVQPELDKRF